MSNSSIQYDQVIIGTESAASTLTAAFSDNQSAVFPIGGMHSIIVYAQYTPAASGRIIYFQLELGPTENDLYFVTKRTDVSGDDALLERYIYTERFEGAAASTEYKPRFAVGDIADKFARFSFKEDGSATFGTVFSRILYPGR